MRYIIMADGKGSRWGNYMGHSKCEICVGGETLLSRTARLLHSFDGDAEVIFTSHDTELRVEGASRYEPQNNVLEIDRFTNELIADDVCFLYGDVLYSEETIRTVVGNTGHEPLLFVGSRESVCAVIVHDGELFKGLVSELRKGCLEGRLGECKGWQVYHLYAKLPLEGKTIGEHYILTDSFTRDFNSPSDYEAFLSGYPFSKGEFFI